MSVDSAAFQIAGLTEHGYLTLPMMKSTAWKRAPLRDSRREDCTCGNTMLSKIAQRGSDSLAHRNPSREGTARPILSALVRIALRTFFPLQIVKTFRRLSPVPLPKLGRWTAACTALCNFVQSFPESLI
jgi:hypothetical protein